MTTSQRLPKETEQEREIATILLDDSAVSINTEKPFVFASGIVSPIYCDLRLLMGVPGHRQRIVEILAERMQERYPQDDLDVVAGVATAGIPWAAWIAARLGKPMAYVRDSAKGHGMGQQVEGRVSPGQTAVILEDLTSTGGSALNSVEALRAIGVRVDRSFSILTYGFASALEAYQKAEVTLVSLCGISTLLEIATETDRITTDQRHTVQEWLDKGPMVASRVDRVNP